MIVLTPLARAEWLDLGPAFGRPAAEPGQPPEIGLLVRSLSSLDFRIAESAARAAIRDARRGLEALQPYGLSGRADDGRLINLSDPMEAMGAGVHMTLVESALRGVLEIRGVRNADRTPAPLTRETLGALLLDERVARPLQARLESLLRLITAVDDDGRAPGQDPPEGNVSGASPAGSSDPASAPTSAPAAAPAAPPAPTASPSADSSAPRSSTARAPKKARRSGASSSPPRPGPAAG